jgi:DUF4097 and DUF4098 domain-containing protein YvlB
MCFKDIYKFDKERLMKDLYKRPVLYVLAFFSLTLAAFAQEERKETLINMQTIPLDGVETLTITCRDDVLVLLESKNGKVVVKEYRDESQKQDKTQGSNTLSYTTVDNSVLGITVRTTTRTVPFQNNGYTEVYIPPSFLGSFKFTAESSVIRSEVNLNSGREVDIAVTNGDLDLKQVSAERINITMSAGSFRAERLAGAEITMRHSAGPIEIGEVAGLLSLEALSGPIKVKGLTGGGSITTRAGTIDIVLRNAIEDFSCSLTNGSINIAIPQDLSYNLDAEAKSGAVTITPPGGGSPFRVPGSIQWTFGNEAEITLAAKVSTGSIAIGPEK